MTSTDLASTIPQHPGDVSGAARTPGGESIVIRPVLPGEHFPHHADPDGAAAEIAGFLSGLDREGWKQ